MATLVFEDKEKLNDYITDNLWVSDEEKDCLREHGFTHYGDGCRCGFEKRSLYIEGNTLTDAQASPCGCGSRGGGIELILWLIFAVALLT